MKIRLWGTRGSLPRSLTNSDLIDIFEKIIDQATAKGVKTTSSLKRILRTPNNGILPDPITYGGKTTCTEVTHKGESVLVDMGTGITAAAAVARPQGNINIFLTHMHWDHLNGMPFFAPYLYSPDYTLTIYHVHPNAPEYVALQMNGINFPVKWELIADRVHFKKINAHEPVTIGTMTATAFRLDHPGGCYGYRFDAGGKSAAIGVDSEYKRLAPTELGLDLPYYQHLDLLIFDAQYEMAELANKYDWGHCSPSIGVDLALREGIRNLVLSHHDFLSNETHLERMLDSARNYLKTQLPAYQEIWEPLGVPDGPRIFNAFDGLEIDLGE